MAVVLNIVLSRLFLVAHLTDNNIVLNTVFL